MILKKTELIVVFLQAESIIGVGFNFRNRFELGIALETLSARSPGSYLTTVGNDEVIRVQQ